MQPLLLVVPSLVVKQNADDDDYCSKPAEECDLIAIDENRQPDCRGPLHRIAYTAEITQHNITSLLLLLLLHLFNGLFSRTTWVSWKKKGKTSLDLNEPREDGVGMQWHQLDHMQTICTLLQTDNHTNTSSLNVFTGRMLFLTPNQQRQSTEGNITKSLLNML